MDIVLTHGILPTFEQYCKQYVKHCPHGIYRIRNDRLVGDQDLTCETLWYFIKDNYNSDDPKLVELISCILETLSIEWI